MSARPGLPSTSDGASPRLVAAALAALLLLPGAAAALDVEVEVGVDGAAVEGGWAPVLVRCKLGPSEPALEGRVVLDRPREAVAAYSAPLRVAPGETATARLVVPSLTAAPWTVRVEDATGRTIATVEPTSPPKMVMDEERVVVLGAASGLPSLGLKPAERIRVCRVSAQGIPREAEVLRDVSAIVLRPTGDAALLELARDASAVAALEAWVRRGGVLLLTGGGEPFWRGSPLDALLPARCDGDRDAETVTALSHLVGIVPRVGPGEPPPAPVPVLVATPRKGAVVESVGDRRPLIVRRDLGAGRIVLLTFDPDAPSLRGASGTGDLLRRLLAGRPRSPRLRPEDVDDLVGGLVEATPPLGVGWFYGLAFAAVAQVGGIALLAGLMARRRGPLAGLLVTPVVSIGVAAAVLLAGSLGRGHARAVVLVLTVEDGTSRETLVDVSVLAGEREAFTLELPPGLRPEAMAPVGLDVTALRGARPTLQSGPEGRAQVGPFAVHAHGTARLSFTGAGLDLPSSGLDVYSTGSAADSAPLSTSTVWPTIRVRAREGAPDGLVTISLRTTGVRAGRLAPLPRGQGVTFDPGTVTPLHDTPAADLASLGERAGRHALLEGVGRVLHGAFTRALGGVPDPDTDPLPMASAWALTCERVTDAPLVIRRASGEALPIEVVRVTCVAAARDP